jgi:hypothetical protein
MNSHLHPAKKGRRERGKTERKANGKCGLKFDKLWKASAHKAQFSKDFFNSNTRREKDFEIEGNF